MKLSNFHLITSKYLTYIYFNSILNTIHNIILLRSHFSSLILNFYLQYHNRIANTIELYNEITE